LFKRTFAFKNSKGKESVSFPIHIKLDTGMHRLGFEDDSMDELIATLKGNNGEGAKYFVASGHK
jgi:alanine racemase